MSTYICIPNGDVTETYPTDTQDEIEVAQAAMRAAGLSECDVFAGDPDCPDSYKNGMKLFATPAIEYTYLDSDRTERIGSYTGDRDAAIDRAIEYLGAGRYGDAYRYHAIETGSVFEVDADELSVLGAALLEHPDGDVYSLWCTR